LTRYNTKIDRFILKALKMNGSLTCGELCKLLRSYCDKRVGFGTTWIHLEKLCKPSIGMVKKDGWSGSESDLFGKERCYSLNSSEFQLE